MIHDIVHIYTCTCQAEGTWYCYKYCRFINSCWIQQISFIPGSVGDSLIQLNRADCHGKLAFDLLYLFTYQPTPVLTLPVDHMSILYQQCYGHKFIPAVYGVKTLQGVIEMAKPVSQLMKVCVHVNVHACCAFIYVLCMHSR